MLTAPLLSSLGFEKGCFAGRGSSWCPSEGLAEPSSGMGFCSGSPVPWWLHFSRRVSLLHPSSKTGLFLLKTSSPVWRHCWAQWLEKSREGNSSRMYLAVTRNRWHGWELERALLHSLVLPCRLCKEGLRSCLCSGWGVSQEKMHWGLTGVKHSGRMPEGRVFHHALTLSIFWTPIPLAAACVPMPRGRQPLQALAAECGLLNSKHINASLRRAAEKTAFTARPADIKGSFWGCEDLAGPGASGWSGSPLVCAGHTKNNPILKKSSKWPEDCARPEEADWLSLAAHPLAVVSHRCRWEEKLTVCFSVLQNTI